MFELLPVRTGFPWVEVTANQGPTPPGKPLNPQGYIGLLTPNASSRDSEIND